MVKNKNIENIIYKLFIIFFFPSFIFSVAFNNYFIGCILIYMVTFKFQKLIFIFNKYNKLSLIFLFFSFYLVATSLMSSHQLHSLESSFLYFSYLIYIFLIIEILKSNKFHALYFFYAGILTFLFLSVDAFYEIINGANILANSSINGRVSGLFGDRWVIGSYMVRFLPVLIGLYFINIKYVSKNFHLIIYFIFFISILTILFSGERKAYLLLFLYVILTFLFLINIIEKKYLFISIVLTLIFLSMPFFFDKFSSRILDNLLLYTTNLSVDENQYLALYKTSLNIFLDNMFFGAGANNFRILCSDTNYYVSQFSCSTHPHNIFIQVLAELGIFGLTFVYLVFGYFIYKTIAFLGDNEFNSFNFGMYSMCLAIILNLWPLVPSGNFFLSWYGFIMYLPIALFIFYSDNKKYG